MLNSIENCRFIAEMEVEVREEARRQHVYNTAGSPDVVSVESITGIFTILGCSFAVSFIILCLEYSYGKVD